MMLAMSSLLSANGRMIGKRLIGKDMERRSLGLFRVLSWHLPGANEETHEIFQSKISSILVKTQNYAPKNTNLEPYH
jgi:hypothetical protein